LDVQAVNFTGVARVPAAVEFVLVPRHGSSFSIRLSQLGLERMLPDLRIVLAFLLSAGACLPAAGQGPNADSVEFFEKKVRPVLVEHCYKCHSADAEKLKGGLRLDSRDGLLRGGDNGPSLVPGNPDKSRFIEAVTYKNVDLQMPPKGKLPEAIIADLTAWVKRGAAWPSKQNSSGAASKDGIDIQERKKNHWAWQPIRVSTPPAVKDTAWARTPIDAFLLARMEANGLKPAEQADRRTLLRRVSFDLTGLPPTPEEIDAFLKDNSADAFAKVVDRLLESPQFGERWARHWLDLVRYAESRGHEMDYTTPNAYQYRDYVIRALNADVPYDRFVVEHIAGDLEVQPRVHPKEGFNESILGTGFWFLGEEVHSPVDTRQDEADRFDNRIDVMTKTFLGLTVSCARCHDHKFDAISSKDYYALFGFLESSSYRLVRFDSLEHNRRIAAELQALRQRAQAQLRKAVADALLPTAGKLSDYLLASREVLLAGPDDDARSGQAHAERYRSRSAIVAEARGLDVEILTAWMSHLRSCASDDPFYSWARLATQMGTREAARFAGELTRLHAAEAEKHRAVEATRKTAEIIVDYSHADPDWMPDDCAFGVGPTRPGDVRVLASAKTPQVRLSERGAATYDRAWDLLRPAAGAENDPSAIGKIIRAGRSIRTPGFSLKSGKLHYLVRGVGQAYAAVGQHTLINGPLHALLVSAINTGGKYRWVTHDLSAYKGQPAHVEFTAQGGQDFEIARVVQSERPPVDEPDPLLLKLTDADAAPTLEKLAGRYQAIFLEACTKLRAGESAEATKSVRILQWSLAHPALFGEGPEWTSLNKLAERQLEEEKKILDRSRAESRLALAMLDGSGVDERVFVRGSPKALGEPTPRRFLEAFAGPAPLSIAHGSGRKELARQMTDPQVNPLLPRVLVNRLWHHLFGRGIVASVDNFGVMGEAPTHPELLDYLADRFVKAGWSIKKMIRNLVLTNAYQMDSRSVSAAGDADPQNLLLHHMRARRLEGEAIRDAMLAVSGRLDSRMYGPSVPVHLTPFLDGRGRPTSGPLDGDGRRSLYLAVRRNFLSPLLLTFDTPTPFSTVGRRTVSNVPAQALILMNDPFVHQQAEVWARQVLHSPGTVEERVTKMYETAFGRLPTDVELGACKTFLEEQAKSQNANMDDVPPWKDLAHTLFNVKEFIYLR
jgi:hypothetical protein